MLLIKKNGNCCRQTLHTTHLPSPSYLLIATHRAFCARWPLNQDSRSSMQAIRPEIGDVSYCFALKSLSKRSCLSFSQLSLIEFILTINGPLSSNILFPIIPRPRSARKLLNGGTYVYLSAGTERIIVLIHKNYAQIHSVPRETSLYPPNTR